jgi:tetratricopeptide (TPR) repeat protein
MRLPNVASRHASAAIAALLAACIASGGTPAAQPAAETDARVREAVRLYDEGRLAEARTLLVEIDTAGAATGPLLYRLAFCQRTAGESAASQQTQARAREALERELATTRDLEVPFYLANTYQNLGLPAELRRVAEQAVGRVERGELPQPADGLSQFRLGKLYADIGREAEATRWYSAALRGLDPAGSAHASYVRWASRYLADGAARRSDWPAVAEHLGRVAEAPDVTVAELDRLAVACVRTGRFAQAEAAWRRAERLDPAEGDRARYAWRLARMAAELRELPAVAPSGRPWSELSKSDLETLLTEQAQAVRSALGESEATAEPERRTELQSRIDAARPVFVAAALEYTARGHGIRETAFMGGYAPLIFHANEWQLR